MKNLDSPVGTAAGGFDPTLGGDPLACRRNLRPTPGDVSEHMFHGPRCTTEPRAVGERRSAKQPLAILLASALALQACAVVGPDYQAPDTRMPDIWHQTLTQGLTPGQADIRTWWRSLNDPVLVDLIERASAGNLDTKQAVARIQAARSAVGFARGSQLPSVDSPGTIEFGRVSEGTAPSLSGRDRTDTLYSVGLDSTWELDLWGRVARSVEAADADLQASVEDYRDVLVSLYASIASTYINIRTLQARIESAEGNIATQSKTLRLVQDRRRAGLASDLEVAQAKLNLATTEASVPLFQRELAGQIHTLGVLLGETPRAIYPVVNQPKPIPQPPSRITLAMPRDLLRQRPDIRSAERQLAAQTARIGVVTADLYPRFSLFGFFAFESFSPGTVFNGGSLGYGLGPSVSWNIFDGGRVRAQIDVEDAVAQQTLALYEQTVLVAMREVEDNIANFVQERQRRDALARSVTAARDAVRLVETLYVTGLTDFQNVQDQQRNLFVQEDLFEESDGLVTFFLVQVYRALGGGWDSDAADTAAGPPEPSPATGSADAPPDSHSDPDSALNESGKGTT